MNKLDFEGLARTLLSQCRVFLPQWLSGGKLIGVEWTCGDLSGKAGNSLKVNVHSGKWADFASGDKGGDLISLYAAIHSIDQKKAYDILSEQFSYNTKPIKDQGQGTKSVSTSNASLIPPPDGTPLPPQLKDKSSQHWRYRSDSGKTLFLVSRYTGKDGKKVFCPWSWSSDGKWVRKMWPEPRPLYGVELLKDNPSLPILIVEGEKAAEAARKIQQKYLVITWPSGSKAVSKANWKPIYGRRILIWPDADEAGTQAADDIVKILYPHCPEIKVLSVSDHTDGFDAADALDKGMTYESFVRWAKPRAQVWKPPPDGNPPVRLPEYNHDEDDIPDQNKRIQRAIIESLEDQLPHGAHPSHYAAWEKLGIARNGNTGNPHYNVDNALRVLERYDKIKDLVWYDEFHQKYFTKWNSKKPREWEDKDDIDLMRIMQTDIGLVRMSKQMVQDAVLSHAHTRSRNEPKDWLKTLTWDGVSRIHGFFPNYMGSVDTDYTRAVSKNFWISMAARIFSPGCKMDNMVILEGPQGKFKSTALNVIGGQWFTEANEHPTSKDFYQILQGVLIVEIAELDAFSKAETETIKRVVSTPSDRFRPPYGRAPKRFPRQCIFVGTTNESHYLRDATGARRFWPITITDIDLSAITNDREQLFAEAVHLFKKGEPWHIVPKSAEDEQESRRESDIWEDVISNYVEGRENVTILDICQSDQCLGMDIDRADRRTQLRIAKILKVLKWECKGQRKVLGKNQKVWAPINPDQPELPEQTEPEPKKQAHNYAPGASNQPIF